MSPFLWRIAILFIVELLFFPVHSSIVSSASVVNPNTLNALQQPNIPNVACTIASPSPTNETCGVLGSLKSPAYATDPQTVSSWMVCRSLCARHGAAKPRPGEYAEQWGCYLFGYTNATGLCQLYFKTLNDMGFVPVKERTGDGGKGPSESGGGKQDRKPVETQSSERTIEARTEQGPRSTGHTSFSAPVVSTSSTKSRTSTSSPSGSTSASSSATQFWSMRCFECPSVCAEPLPVSAPPSAPTASASAAVMNVLDNGGFELNATLDGPWLGAGGSVSTPGYAGSAHAFRCSNSGSSSGCSLAQIVQTCANSTYHLTFAYQASNTSGGVNVHMYGGNLQAEDTLPVPASSGSNGGGWGTAEYWFKTYGAGVTEVGLSFDRGQSGVAVDDAVLQRIDTRVTPFATQPGAAEMVVNGGFETGKLAPWKFLAEGNNPKVYNATVSSPGLNGSKYALLLQGRVGDVSEGGSMVVQNVAGLTLGADYLLTFTAEKKGGQAQYPEVLIGGLLYEPPFFSRLPKFQFAMPFTARQAVMQIALAWNYGPLLVDNVSIKRLS